MVRPLHLPVRVLHLLRPRALSGRCASWQAGQCACSVQSTIPLCVARPVCRFGRPANLCCFVVPLNVSRGRCALGRPRAGRCIPHSEMSVFRHWSNVMRERTRTCGAGGAYAAPVPRVKRTLDALVGAPDSENHHGFSLSGRDGCISHAPFVQTTGPLPSVKNILFARCVVVVHAPITLIWRSPSGVMRRS